MGTKSLGLVAAIVFGIASRAGAQPMLNECDYDDPCAAAEHFMTDASRFAEVTDRQRGYEFEIEYDPNDGNSEDFCPHCRLDIIVSDPGMDLAELDRVGIERDQISTASGMLSSFQSVAAADPTGLAMMLNEGIMGEELDAAVAEIEAIQAHLVTIISALETFERVAGGDFDWSTATIETLIEALALKVDSGFRADFDNPNDPRPHNSGVRVYGPAAYVDALPLSTEDRAALQAALESLPGVSGGLEISGDDDDASRPISYHGYRTDLTVQERTYVVNGTSVFLIVYTIVNETTRVFPFVQAAMIADFDIPPLGYDTSTEFDPATNSVLLYDTIPYTDPEQHYWFGLAPANVGAPVPGTFSFSNFYVSKNFEMAQYGSDNTQLSRYRFFLWDPSISGDHDDAMGKSEKTGGIAQMLGGPLLPGDARSLAFCYAAGEGTSSSAARAELTAAMTACRALYTGLTPNCGDTILQLGEECEPAGTDTCSAACQNLVCGDGRLFAPEECDDGNTVSGDGCSGPLTDGTGGCVLEVCGNGVLQTGEECDDGNVTSSDGCTTACNVARCGDGFVRGASDDCTSGCGCVGYEHCFSGSFTLSDYLLASNSIFEPLRNVPISFQIGFDIMTVDFTTLAAEDGYIVNTGPIHVEMSGHPLAAELARSFEGDMIQISVRATPGIFSPYFATSALTGTIGTRAVNLQLIVPGGGAGRPPITWTLNRNGTPLLDTIRILSGTARLEVPGRPSPDYASGRATASIAVPPPAGSPGEACDDGNGSDFDMCTNECVPAACGDGIVQAVIDEECDDGNTDDTDACVACRLSAAAAAACGNGMLETTNGEECDDMNDVDGDGCSALCRTERCGDGIVLAPEECDDGANGDGDGCTDACVRELCGDGIVQPNEECDMGAANADSAACTTSCLNAVCGDTLVNVGVEECDDGNVDDIDGCSAECALETCGDGLAGPGEACDDGNDVERDGCSPGCQMEVCGDYLPGPGEQCDDGNLASGDGCDKDCKLENLAACGDGTVDAGEQCDDGGTANDDGCSEFCQLENPAACGDGMIDPGEQCDDGNREGGDGCTARCAEERCGDGIQAGGEQCDDGDEESGDGCSSNCIVEPSECGNGDQEIGEQCDDGNDDDTDACTAECRATMDAPLIDTCNNGELDYGEECDDGDRNEGDGCGETCQLEASVCGNARLERGELCDLGDTIDGDGCSSECLIEGEPVPMPTDGGCFGCSVPRGGASLGWGLALLALGAALRMRRRAPR
jgi:MYXO-CTERM domain-containing protein